MALTTANIVTRALRRLSAIDIYEQPSAGQMSHGVDCLQELLNSWAAYSIPTASQVIAATVTEDDATLSDLESTANLARGFYVAGTGIPDNTRIIDVTDSTTVEMSAKATASGAAVSLTFLLLPLDEKFEGAVVALLAVRLAEDLGKAVSPKLAEDARLGWYTILAAYIQPKAATFDLGIPGMVRRQIVNG